MSDPRYPIGPFVDPGTLTRANRDEFIDIIGAAPARLREAVQGLDDAQLDTAYREGGWTVRQVVHHIPDSHLNAYVRLKLALTEDKPTIKPYDEGRWADLADTLHTPVAVSLNLLEALHARWVTLLRNMRDEDFARPLVHPDHGALTVDWLLALYAWHSRHHVGHIMALRKERGW